MRLMGLAGQAITMVSKAEKWLVTRGDLAYSFVYVMRALEPLAAIEVLLHDELTTREVLPRAAQLNPAFFDQVYGGLIQQPKDAAAMRRAVDLLNGYLDEKVDLLFGPVLEHLRQEGGIRTTSELYDYFERQMQSEMLAPGLEWLADKGVIQKVPSPVRLHPKSQVVLDEAAYYYDGPPAEEEAPEWLDRAALEAQPR
jgi:uncharacterized protein